jgi:tetratricopeptide (TPR) repeat protein
MRHDWEPDLFEANQIAESSPARARDLVRNVLERLPRSPLGHLVLAKALSGTGDLDGAAKEIDIVIALEAEQPPTFEVATFQTAALIAMRRGRGRAACGYAARGLALDPDESSSLNLLATALESVQDYAGAEIMRRRVVVLHPTDPRCHTDLATNLLRGGKAEAALAEYRIAIDLDPRNFGAWFGVSIALGQLEQHEEAIEPALRAIDIAPDIALYHSHLGHTLARVGLRPEAIVAFQRVLQFEPENAGIHECLANLFVQQDNFDAALHHIRRAADLEPMNDRYLVALSRMLADKGRVPEAIIPLRQAIELQPDNAELWRQMGELCLRDTRINNDRAALHDAFHSNPESAEAAYQISRALQQLGDFDGAGVAVERALAIDANQPRFVEQKQNLRGLNHQIQAG